MSSDTSARTENDAMMIDRLLEYKATIDSIVSKAFKNNQEFRQTQKDSFEIFVNKRENKPAEKLIIVTRA